MWKIKHCAAFFTATLQVLLNLTLLGLKPICFSLLHADQHHVLNGFKWFSHKPCARLVASHAKSHLYLTQREGKSVPEGRNFHCTAVYRRLWRGPYLEIFKWMWTPISSATR